MTSDGEGAMAVAMERIQNFQMSSSSCVDELPLLSRQYVFGVLMCMCIVLCYDEILVLLLYSLFVVGAMCV